MSVRVRERRFRLAWPLAAALLGALPVVLIGTLVIMAGLTHQLNSSKVKSAAGLFVMILVLAAVGLVVARHQPRNPIGWLLLGAAAWFPLTIVGSAYATLVYHSGYRHIPVVGPVALVAGQMFTAAFSARLKDAVDLEAVRADLLDVVHAALEPAHVSVWVRRHEW